MAGGSAVTDGGRLTVAGGACRKDSERQRSSDTPQLSLAIVNRPPATGHRQLFLAIALACTAFAASASPLSLQRYVESLETLRNAPKNVRPEMAKRLAGTKVDSPNGGFVADASLLAAVSAKSPDVNARLDAELAALRQLAPAPRTAAPDPRVIEAMRRDEAVSALRRGGGVGTVPTGNEGAIVRWVEKIGDAIVWLWKKLEALAEWMMRWWPRVKEPGLKKVPKSPGVPFLVTALVIVIVAIVTVLALEVLRRSRPAERDPIKASTPQASKGDEDPLSRGATEWERYAAQLVAAGRIREAIRAWYHAVLVTLYATGILRFRKGRTNWEYIAALSPHLSSRSAFVHPPPPSQQAWYGPDDL